MKPLYKALFLIPFSFLVFLLIFYGCAYFYDIPLLDSNTRIRIYDNRDQLVTESLFNRDSEWLPLQKIPQPMLDAVISIEDRRFYDHYGLDPVRISKAMISNLAHQEIVEGGSTITQQLARNLYLTLDQTLSRKIKEAWLAAALEMHFSKQQILETYMNTLYYGHGVWGISRASRHFFDKPLEECTVAQMATLAAIPNGPSLYSPLISHDNALKRRNLVLAAMKQNHVLSTEDYLKAREEKLVCTPSSQPTISQIHGYYLDAVMKQLRSQGLLKKENLQQGLDVYTCLDQKKQQILTTSILQNSPDTDLETAGIILEPFTFRIQAMAGGKDYRKSQYNRALYSSRQSGSTIKPLLYYIALHQGMSPSSLFTSTPTRFQTEPGVFYAPGNYRQLYPDKEISMINAIAVSDNIYAVKTHLFLGTECLSRTLEAFDIQEEPSPSLALGATHFPLIDLARIYNTFASEGLVEKPYLIRSVTDHYGNLLYHHHAQPKQLLHRTETLMLNQMLRAPFDIHNMQTMTPSLLGYEPHTLTAAKSGSSDWDSLIAGFNPQMTVVVWSGYDENRKLETVQERRVPKLVWRQVFDTLYPEGQEGPWYLPDNDLEARKVDPVSGQPSLYGSIYWFRATDP